MIFTEEKKESLSVRLAKRRLVYINISDDRWIRESLFSSRHFVQSSVVHILDDHMIVIYFHNNTNVTVRRRKPWSVIDDNSSWFWIISCCDTLFLSIFEPVFRIPTPSNIFIFCHETGTVSPHKITTAFFYFK